MVAKNGEEKVGLPFLLRSICSGGDRILWIFGVILLIENIRWNWALWGWGWPNARRWWRKIIVWRIWINGDLLPYETGRHSYLLGRGSKGQLFLLFGTIAAGVSVWRRHLSFKYAEKNGIPLRSRGDGWLVAASGETERGWKVCCVRGCFCLVMR